MDNQSYGLIQDNLSNGQRCYCDDGFSTCWAQAKQLVLEIEKTPFPDHGVCTPSHNPITSSDEMKVRFSVNPNSRKGHNQVGKPQDLGSEMNGSKKHDTTDDSKWAFNRTERPSVKVKFNKDNSVVSSTHQGMSLKTKRELLKKRHSDPTMPTTSVIPIRKPRAKSEGQIFKGIPSYVRKAWENMSIDNSDDGSGIQGLEIKTTKASDRDCALSKRRTSLETNKKPGHSVNLGKLSRRNTDPGIMTYVEEREATLRSLRATSFSTKQTILQRVSIANGLNFSEIRNKSNCFSKKAVSLIESSNSRSFTPLSSTGNPETLVDKVAKTFPLHMMMTTEDAIYGLSHALNIARRNQHLLDNERLISEKSQIPDPRFLRLELSLLRLNDEQTQKTF